MKSIVLLSKNDIKRLISNAVIIVNPYDMSFYSDDLKAASSIFSFTEPFEFPVEKILARIELESGTSTIAINNIVSLLPIDNNSKQSYKTEFPYWKVETPQIQIEELFYNKCATRLITQKTAKGIELFREMCNLPKIEQDDAIAASVKVGTEYRLKTKYFNLQYLEREAWSFLVAYERYAPYPQGNIGFFCDIIEMIVYLKKENLIGFRDNLISENAPTKIIMGMPKDSTWTNIITKLEESEKGKHFIQMASDSWGSIFAPLIYLYLKEKIRKSGLTPETWNMISKIKARYPYAFDWAATAVGGFFNYSNIKEEYLKMIQCGKKPIESFDSPKTETSQQGTHKTENGIQPLDDVSENRQPGSDEDALDIKSEDWIAVFKEVLSGNKYQKKLAAIIDALQSESFLKSLTDEYYKGGKLSVLVSKKYCTNIQAEKVYTKMLAHQNNNFNNNLFNQ